MQINLKDFLHFRWFIKPDTAVFIKSKTQFDWIRIWSFKWPSVRQFLLLENKSLKELKAPLTTHGHHRKLAMTFGSSFRPCAFFQLSTDPI